MSARRCTKCQVRWPTTSEFLNCPECGAHTEWAGAADPEMTVADALALKRSSDFENFYALREVERCKRGDTSPEALGMIEGRQEARRLVALEQLVR